MQRQRQEQDSLIEMNNANASSSSSSSSNMNQQQQNVSILDSSRQQQLIISPPAVSLAKLEQISESYGLSGLSAQQRRLSDYCEVARDSPAGFLSNRRTSGMSLPADDYFLANDSPLLNDSGGSGKNSSGFGIFNFKPAGMMQLSDQHRPLQLFPHPQESLEGLELKPMHECEACGKKLCSMRSLKRHRNTCKRVPGTPGDGGSATTSSGVKEEAGEERKSEKKEQKTVNKPANMAAPAFNDQRAVQAAQTSSAMTSKSSELVMISQQQHQAALIGEKQKPALLKAPMPVQKAVGLQAFVRFSGEITTSPDPNKVSDTVDSVVAKIRLQSGGTSSKSLPMNASNFSPNPPQQQQAYSQEMSVSARHRQQQQQQITLESFNQNVQQQQQVQQQQHVQQQQQQVLDQQQRRHGMPGRAVVDVDSSFPDYNGTNSNNSLYKMPMPTTAMAQQQQVQQVQHVQQQFIRSQQQLEPPKSAPAIGTHGQQQFWPPVGQVVRLPPQAMLPAGHGNAAGGIQTMGGGFDKNACPPPASFTSNAADARAEKCLVKPAECQPSAIAPIRMGSGQKPVAESTQPSAKNIYRYLCPECDKPYSCRKNVKRHRISQHKVAVQEAQDGFIKRISLTETELAQMERKLAATGASAGSNKAGKVEPKLKLVEGGEAAQRPREQPGLAQVHAKPTCPPHQHMAGMFPLEGREPPHSAPLPIQQVGAVQQQQHFFPYTSQCCPGEQQQHYNGGYGQPMGHFYGAVQQQQEGAAFSVHQQHQQHLYAQQQQAYQQQQFQHQQQQGMPMPVHFQQQQQVQAVHVQQQQQQQAIGYAQQQQQNYAGMAAQSSQHASSPHFGAVQAPQQFQQVQQQQQLPVEGMVSKMMAQQQQQQLPPVYYQPAGANASQPPQMMMMAQYGGGPGRFQQYEQQQHQQQQVQAVQQQIQAVQQHVYTETLECWEQIKSGVDSVPTTSDSDAIEMAKILEDLKRTEQVQQEMDQQQQEEEGDELLRFVEGISGHSNDGTQQVQAVQQGQQVQAVQHQQQQRHAVELAEADTTFSPPSQHSDESSNSNLNVNMAPRQQQPGQDQRVQQQQQRQQMTTTTAQFVSMNPGVVPAGGLVPAGTLLPAESPTYTLMGGGGTQQQQHFRFDLARPAEQGLVQQQHQQKLEKGSSTATATFAGAATTMNVGIGRPVVKFQSNWPGATQMLFSGQQQQAVQQQQQQQKQPIGKLGVGAVQAKGPSNHKKQQPNSLNLTPAVTKPARTGTTPPSSTFMCAACNKGYSTDYSLKRHRQVCPVLNVKERGGVAGTGTVRKRKNAAGTSDGKEGGNNGNKLERMDEELHNSDPPDSTMNESPQEDCHSSSSTASSNVHMAIGGGAVTMDMDGRGSTASAAAAGQGLSSTAGQQQQQQ